jgi:hypothetical protein
MAADSCEMPTSHHQKQQTDFDDVRLSTTFFPDYGSVAHENWTLFLGPQNVVVLFFKIS